jgi:uncharacterized phage protein gp47/JayE
MSANNAYGITRFGYKVKPLDIIEDDLRAELLDKLGSNIDLEQTSPLWRNTQVIAIQLSYLWVKAQELYYNSFVSSSEGSALDLAGRSLGLERKPAEPAEVELTIYKNTSAEVTVPKRSHFQTTEGILFYTEIEITIPSGDPLTTFGTVNAICTTKGIIGNVGANSITLPAQTILGVDSSDNALSAIGGLDIESDIDYKRRLGNLVKATYTPEVIRRTALNVEGVSGASIKERDYDYDVLIAPTAFFDEDLRTEVENAVANVNPITVEFFVLESTTVIINVYADVTLKSGYAEETVESEISISINNYISNLQSGESVLKNKIIGLIMEYIGIDNLTTIDLEAIIDTEEITFSTGTDEYELLYTPITSVIEVTGTVSGSPYTFAETTDYNVLSSPARIDWSPAGTNPDNGTKFNVKYEIPENGNGDIEIKSEAVAKFGLLDLTIP